MLFPKKVKHRKWQRARRNPIKAKVESRATTIAFGSYGLKATTHARVRSNQIEAARGVMSRALGKVGRVYIRIFPDRPFTSKPAEVKMGKGKGDLDGYEFEVWPGRILFEIEGVGEDIAKEAIRKAGTKLPLKSWFVTRENP